MYLTEFLKSASCHLLQEVYSVYRILTGILNTGNIEFAAISSQHQTDKSEVPDPEALDNGIYFLILSVL